jgi:hypothetical protein
MIPKIHAKGTSFKGAAAYLLHDKDAATSGRVGWVEMVNITTKNPETAWRVMAATAMAAARLKTEAGIKKSGRSSKDAVLHLTLAWSPEQKPDRKEMSDLARRAIEALKAGDRQAMIVCHTDEKHPHVHILLNRVSPTDGRLLSSSKEKLALSALALAYEQETGQVLCKERETNAAKRQQGEYVRAEKDIPRPEFEALREAQKEVEKEIPAAAAKANPEIAAQIRATMRQQLREKLANLKESLRPQWQALYQRQQAETLKAQVQKASFIERLRNWMSGKDKGQSPAPGSSPGQALPFQKENLASAAWNSQARNASQRRERASLGDRYQGELRKVITEIKGVAQVAVRQFFVAHDRGGSAIRQEFKPAASPAGQALFVQSPAPPQTEPQKARSALAEKFMQQDAEKRQREHKTPAAPRPKDKDREWEP